MWKSENKKTALSQYSGKTTLIAFDAELRGNMRFNGAVQIDGRIIGNIEAEEGIVSITEHGYVEGIIKAPSVVINGAVVGDVHALEHLALQAGARIDGDLYYRFMEMVTGAQINGQLCYLGETPSAESPKGLVDVSDFKNS